MRPVVVANDSEHLFHDLRVQADGKPIGPPRSLAPGRVLVAQVPVGTAAVHVGDLELTLPTEGGATVVMDTEGVEWAVGPLMWHEPPPDDLQLLPWGSKLSEDLATGLLAPERISSLLVAPWAGNNTRPTRHDQLEGGTTVRDQERIAAFLAAVQDAHTERPTGPLTDGQQWVVLAQLEPGIQAWFLMTVASEGLGVQPPPMVHEPGRHDREVGPLAAGVVEALVGGGG